MASIAGGLIKGLGVTLKELTETVTEGPATVQYRHVEETPAVRRTE